MLPDIRHTISGFQADRLKIHLALSRQDFAGWLEYPALQFKNIFDQVLVEQYVPHLFMQNEIYFFGGSEVAAVGTNELYVVNAIVLRDQLSDFDNI